mgnify:CR=1 FL=1
MATSLIPSRLYNNQTKPREVNRLSHLQTQAYVHVVISTPLNDISQWISNNKGAGVLEFSEQSVNDISQWITDNKGWEFSEQPDVFGYINNPYWTNTKTLTHWPCGYWGKCKKG